MLKQCKTLGQSLDHDALVAINEKLEKIHKLAKLSFFVDVESILSSELPRRKEIQKGKKKNFYRDTLLDAALLSWLLQLVKSVDFKISGAK